MFLANKFYDTNLGAELPKKAYQGTTIDVFDFAVEVAVALENI